MKKIISLVLVICALVLSLTSCTIVQGALLGLFVGSTSEAGEKAEEMLYALSEGRGEDAILLMHPGTKENAADGINEMISYINGREIESLQQTGYYTNVSLGINGIENQEQVTFDVVFTDGTAISIDAVYVTNSDGAGFYRYLINISSMPDNSTDQGESGNESI